MLYEQQKASREKLVFLDFVARSGLTIKSESVENRRTPEPDIRCFAEDKGWQAYELVEVCAADIAATIPKISDGGVAYLRSSDPSILIIKKKISKSYATRYPIHLLCYTDGRVLFSDQQIVQNMKSAILCGSGPFESIWLLADNCHLVWSANTASQVK